MIMLSPSLKEDIKEFIKKNEGLRLQPYKDSKGILTIGYGHNLNKGISLKIAEAIFEEDFEEALLVLENVLKEHNIKIENLPDEVVKALLDMAFNLGYKLGDFKKMLNCIKEEDWAGALIEAMDSKWAKQVKNRAIKIAGLFKEAVNSVHSIDVEKDKVMEGVEDVVDKKEE